jgi:hypothetical protein
MSSAKPRLIAVVGGQSASTARPTSLPNMFDRRSSRRQADRMRPVSVSASRPACLPVADVTRDAAIDRWIALITRHCGTREACAAMFGVTFQTACNWFDGVSAPSAAAVFQAVDWWGEDMRSAADRRAA